LSQNVPCKHQKKVQEVSKDPTLSTKQQTDGKMFSMITINDNNIAQHTRRSKGENVAVGVDGWDNK
jgi:hypothetical protein